MLLWKLSKSGELRPWFWARCFWAPFLVCCHMSKIHAKHRHINSLSDHLSFVCRTSGRPRNVEQISNGSKIDCAVGQSGCGLLMMFGPRWSEALIIPCGCSYWRNCFRVEFCIRVWSQALLVLERANKTRESGKHCEKNLLGADKVQLYTYPVRLDTTKPPRAENANGRQGNIAKILFLNWFSAVSSGVF